MRGRIDPGHTAAAQSGAPAIVKSDAARPAIPQGVAVGDVTAGRAVVWSRTDRPARMLVEYSTSDRFENVLRRTGPAALDSTDFTARLVLTDLPANQRIFYRVSFQDLTDLRAFSAPELGSFRTPPDAQRPRDVTLAWSADTVGQGWGINPDWGGLRLYRTMRDAEPDVFIHCGDTIYADGVIQPQVKLDDGSMWTNIVTEAKSKVAQTLDDYRGCYKYNLLDGHMRTFNAGVAADCDLGRSRGARQLVRGARPQRRRPLSGQEHGAALFARAAGVPRVQPDWPSCRRRGADSPHHRLRPVVGDLRARSAQLPRREQRATARHRSRRSPRFSATTSSLRSRLVSRAAAPRGRSSPATCRSG